MNKKFQKLYDALVEYGYKDVTDEIDMNKGKRRLKKKQVLIVFDYDDVYFVDRFAKMTEL